MTTVKVQKKRIIYYLLFKSKSKANDILIFTQICISYEYFEQ